MERTFYDLKAVLMKELDKIVKKGDISPTELANVEKSRMHDQKDS